MNKSLIRAGSLILAAGLMLMPLHSANAFPATQKKLIEAGWERPDASDLLKYQKQIEKSPYDGIVLMLMGKDDAGKGVSLQNRIFEPMPLKLKWFAEDSKELKSFHSTKLTDNFVRVSTSRNTPDWFDDAAWKQVIDNWKIAATIAKEGNLKGICFDPEMYSGAELFTYNAQKYAKKYTFDQYRAKVRQRGREIIQAVSSIYPDMVFFTFRMNDINRSHAKNIQASRYNLYPALINGWLDVAPPEMTFVDGGESAYTYSEPDDFLKTANWIRNTGLQLIAPENRRKYRAQVQVSFGLYLDAYSYYKLNSSDSRDRRYALQPLDGSRLNRLQSNVNAAVDAADEYVWTWGEHYRWWPTDTKNVNPQTWEEVLPGTTKVLLQAVHPELAAAAQQAKFDQLIQEKKVTNLLTNSDFSNTAHNTAKAALDWQTNNAPVGWSTWQKKVDSQPPGIFSVDPKGGEHGGNAASLAGMFQGFFIQQIPVKAGEEYFARVRVHQSGAGIPRLDVRWQNESGWTDSQNFLVDTQQAKDDWITLTLPATVPAGATKLIVLIGVDGQSHAGDKVWFDNVQLYKMPS
jgi:hypothetical protein